MPKPTILLIASAFCLFPLSTRAQTDAPVSTEETQQENPFYNIEKITDWLKNGTLTEKWLDENAERLSKTNGWVMYQKGDQGCEVRFNASGVAVQYRITTMYDPSWPQLSLAFNHYKKISVERATPQEIEKYDADGCRFIGRYKYSQGGKTVNCTLMIGSGFCRIIFSV